MTWIKICGITNREDALLAVEAGADALGFVFYIKSPRSVQPAEVKSIVSQLPKKTEKVGVFVGDSPAQTLEKKRIVSECGLTAIQVHSFHSSPTPSLRNLEDLSSIAAKLYIAWPARFITHGRMGGFKWRTKAAGKVSAIVLDSGTKQIPGGTGKTFDWKTAAPVLSAIGEEINFVIAGGLNPNNVDEAVRVLKPYGVDVTSGVEARPGKKDPEKIGAFVQAVRSADKAA